MSNLSLTTEIDPPVPNPQEIIPSLKYLQSLRGFMERALGQRVSSIVVEDTPIFLPDLDKELKLSVIRFFPQFCFNPKVPVKGVKHLDLFIHPVEKFPAYCLRDESGPNFGIFDTKLEFADYVPLFTEVSFNGVNPKSKLQTILNFNYSVN